MIHRPLPSPPEPPECQEAFERMPWLVNGSLPPMEARELESHAARCALCHGRLSVERELFAGIRRVTGNVQQAPLAGWARLEGAIAATGSRDRAEAKAPADHSPAANAGQSLPPLLPASAAPTSSPAPAAPEAPPTPRRRHTLRLALTLQAAAIAVLSIALLWVLVARSPDEPQGAYRTVATPDATLDVAGNAWRVEFDARTVPAEVTTLLASHGLRVLAGPSEDGIYTVAPRAGATPDVQALRADPRVRLLQPLGVETPPRTGR